MKRIMKSIVSVLLVGSALGVSAATQITPSVTIEEVYAWSDSAAWIQVASPNPLSNPYSCPLEDNYFELRGLTTAHGKLNYATALLAYSMGDSVRIFVDGCAASGYSRIKAIVLDKAQN